MRCGRCGNENSETNRFCGMCGAPLIAKAQAVAQASGPGPAARPTGSVAAARAVAAPVQKETARPVAREASAPAAASGVTAERSPAVLSSINVRASYVKASSEPIITGPSFLGLNKPADPGRDALQSSSSVDYLLEDDEEEPKRGRGKFVLVLAALVLAAGFGYLHWKQGGFAWLNSDGTKLAAAPTSEGAQNGAASGSPNGAANPSSTTAPAGTVGSASVPATDGATAVAPTASGTVQSNPSQGTLPGTPAGTGPVSSPSAASQSAEAATPSQTTPAAQESNSSAPADSPSQNAVPPPTTEANPAETPATPTSKIPIHKPSPAKLPARPVDPVAEAERLIYGNGVRQDCDRGMRALKSAAEQSNAKAMISLGALYSTGSCVPRDLPTSYRWFALALHKEPDDQALQDDLQKVWGQMTQAERQLAIKLTQ
ncbi:MAG: zinc-ribbon domain-containing protein [Candidatus Sulfotelmatobacter sp.]